LSIGEWTQTFQEDKLRKILFVLLFSVISTAVFAVGPALTKFNLEVLINPSNGIDSVMLFNITAGTQGVNCTNATCPFSFNSGTKLKLVASSSAPTFAFSNWGTATGSAAACANSNNRECSFTITADSKVPAVFKRQFAFRVQVGNGDGIIKVTQHGTQFLFDCANKAPLSCSIGMLEGTPVKIEAIAKAGSQFQNFSAQTGNATACTGQGANFTCNIKVNSDTSLVANFIPIP
jgi:hypothetical protein